MEACSKQVPSPTTRECHGHGGKYYGNPCHNHENHALPLTGTHERSTDNPDMWAIIPVVATENGAQTSLVQKDLGDNSRVLNIPKEGTFNFLVEKKLSKDVGEKHRCHKFSSINYNALMTAKRNVKANEVASMHRRQSLRVRRNASETPNIF